MVLPTRFKRSSASDQRVLSVAIAMKRHLVSSAFLAPMNILELMLIEISSSKQGMSADTSLYNLDTNARQQKGKSYAPSIHQHRRPVQHSRCCCARWDWGSEWWSSSMQPPWRDSRPGHKSSYGKSEWSASKNTTVNVGIFEHIGLSQSDKGRVL